MLLYLTKYSRPDLCNVVVRELAKFMDKATKGTFLEMLRVVKFVIDTKNFCIRIKPELKGKNWVQIMSSEWMILLVSRFNIL
jgi:hypothetical protein